MAHQDKNILYFYLLESLLGFAVIYWHDLNSKLELELKLKRPRRLTFINHTISSREIGSTVGCTTG